MSSAARSSPRLGRSSARPSAADDQVRRARRDRRRLARVVRLFDLPARLQALTLQAGSRQCGDELDEPERRTRPQPVVQAAEGSRRHRPVCEVLRTNGHTRPVPDIGKGTEQTSRGIRERARPDLDHGTTRSPPPPARWTAKARCTCPRTWAATSRPAACGRRAAQGGVALVRRLHARVVLSSKWTARRENRRRRHLPASLAFSVFLVCLVVLIFLE